MKDMTLVEETRYRLSCCIGGTNEGWGELVSLRNHLMRVTKQIGHLVGLYDEIEALPEDAELRDDEIIIDLMQEYRELVDAKADAEMFLGVEPKVTRLCRRPRRRLRGPKGQCLADLLLPEVRPTLKNLGLIE